MNDSQLSSSMMNVSAADMARKASTCSSITPDMDPRNQEYLQQGKRSAPSTNYLFTVNKFVCLLS